MPIVLRTSLAVLALSLALAPLAAPAHHRAGHDGGSGHSAGENRGGGSGQRGARDRSEEAEVAEEEEVEGEEEEAGNRPCAWGLADRATPCVPPGQARRGVTTEEWIGAPESTFTAAQDLEDEQGFGLVANADRLGLPELPAGQVYAVAGDALVIADVTEATDADGVVTTTYTYNSTIRRAAFPGGSD
jgi:hypothetical protein